MSRFTIAVIVAVGATLLGVLFGVIRSIVVYRKKKEDLKEQKKEWIKVDMEFI